MTPYRIRLVAEPGRLRDSIYYTLADLDNQCFQWDDPYPKHGCYWWLAYQGTDPVAFAGLKPLDGPNKGIGYFCRAGVLEAVEGAGLQRRLIRVRIRKAKDIGLTELLSYTHPENFPSAANLLRCGFRFHKPTYHWGFQGALYFRMALR